MSMQISGSLYAVQFSWQGNAGTEGVWKDLSVTEVVVPLCRLNLWGFTLDYVDCIHTSS